MIEAERHRIIRKIVDEHPSSACLMADRIPPSSLWPRWRIGYVK
jgi:hypothetical protein